MAVNNNSRLASFQLGGGFGKYRQNLEDKRTPRAEGELAPVEKLNKATSEFLGKGLSKVYSAVTPEEDTLNEIENNKQIRELQIAQALKGTQFEDYIGQGDLPSAVIQNPVVAQRLKDLGFKRQGFKEGMSRTGQFMYGEQRQAFEKLAAGEELTSQDKLAITLAPLDLFDVIAPGIIAKVSKFGFTKASKIEDVLKDPRLADDPEIQRIGGLLLERPTAPGMPSGQILQKAEDGAGGGSQKAQIKNKEKQQQYFNSEEARESFYDESDDINMMFDIKKLNDPENQKIEYGQNIPAHEFYENQYHGGVGDLGNADAFKKLKKLSYYPEYKKLIQEAAKEHLGESFPAYRLVRGDNAAAKEGKPSLNKDINSYSLNPENALSLHNLIDYDIASGKNRNNLLLQEVYINAKDLVMRGKTSEEEIIVNTKKLNTDTVRVFDPSTGEMIKDATKGELVGKELFKFSDKTILGSYKKPKGFALGGTAEGDQVMSEENQEPRTPDNESMLSKVGNFFIPKAEASTLKPLFKPIFDWMMVGNAPKTVTNIQKSQQKVLAGPPTLEKRYNIISPEGQKVYQSKSMDDADQKALVLGDQEGLTFRVEEIEVPVKVKKKKTGTQLTVTMTPDAVVGSGTNRLYYSKLMQAMNSPTGNLTIKGQNVARDTVALPAKEWQDYFRSIGVRESELQDSYIRQYLNKKGGFNNETQQFTINTPITYDEIADLAGNSPTNFIQSSKYGDYAGNLKYGNSGRYENYINGSREERVLWVDSADIRGDIGGLPRDIRNYEGHSNMRQVTDDIDFDIKNKLAQGGEPYVIGWSLNSNRLGTAATGKKIIVNTADEIQSDFLQKAASLKSQLKRDLQSLTEIETPRPDLLKETQARLENIFRPMPATAFEIAEQLENLKKSNEIFQNVAKMEIDRVNPGIFSSLKAASKLRDEALAAINQKIDDVDMNKMFPNIPLKNQKDWVDALIKNDVYEAARKRFYFDENGALQTNKEAPSHYTVAPSKAVKASNPGVGIKLDPTDPNRSGKAVAYDMQYGGPKAVDHTGAHFTSNSEESLRRIAKMKNSELSIGTVDFGTAGEKVETFLLELTPDMLTPYPTYFKDGGVVQKKNVYNPLLSINDVLRPIGVY